MHEISLKSEEILRFLGIPITNTAIQTFLVSAALIVAAYFFGKKINLIPGRAQNIFEVFYEASLNMAEEIFQNRKTAERYLPFILTFFIFILFANWSGLLPVLGAVGLREGGHFLPIFRSPFSDVNFTLSLAVISVVAANIYGARQLGFFGHIKKYFNFTGPISFFVGILEFVSEFSKVVSLSFRLFGNIIAGEVLLVIVSALMPFFAPLPFYFLEILVGFMQAFVFAMLTLLFISVAIAEHDAGH